MRMLYYFRISIIFPFWVYPIAVHAHELGNDVPRSVIENYDVENNCQSHSTHDNQVEDYICLRKKNEKVNDEKAVTFSGKVMHVCL